MNNLLIEYMPFVYDRKSINESAGTSEKEFIVKGVLQRAGVANQNGRVYPKPILEREVSRYAQTEIKERRALGELDHPESSVVNLRNVSHNILEVGWNGDDVVGVVQILDTPAGNILKSLFRAGVTLGISSRGMGSLKQIDESTSEVLNDFQLVCWDFVSNPSTHGAFLSPVNPVNESIQYKNNTDEKAHMLIRDIVCELSGICCLK